MWTSVLEGQNDLHESVKGRVMTSGSSDTPASIFSTKQLKAASFYTHLRSAEELNEDILTHTVFSGSKCEHVLLSTLD